ncbi:hypothetical protein WKW80_29585 [Variovorax humicola]|uniref:Uncharacterized protein n=1 Tax=Variovorax humicola TaxID=1769758 RepID=A0ABU8W842_9BURK
MSHTIFWILGRSRGSLLAGRNSGRLHSLHVAAAAALAMLSFLIEFWNS